jgi:S1-C subfamily serine protease
VIVDEDGIVVSNYHVVGGAQEIKVHLKDRREFDAEILLADESVDLAVLRLINPSGLNAIEIGDSDELLVGDLVLAIGNPFGIGQSITSGIVSGLSQSVLRGDLNSGYFVQTDAPINPGNSGGALVDMTGKLIGINTSILTKSGGSNGIGFAIPANLVSKYVEQAKSGKSVFERPWAGIEVQDIDQSLANALNMRYPTGLLITEIHPQSEFYRAGLRIGDVILSVQGYEINSELELSYRLAILGVGTSVSVSFLRSDQKNSVEISLRNAPDEPVAKLVNVKSNGPFFESTVAQVNPKLINDFNLSLRSTGVMLTQVSNLTQRLGLRESDIIASINGAKISHVGDLLSLNSAKIDRWSLDVIRNKRLITIRF